MMAGLSARLWAALAALGAILATLGTVWLRGRQSGLDRARAQAMEQAAQQRTARDEIDRSVARDPDPAEQLRRDWSR